jgi:lipid-A-disaccharide synthase
VNPPEHPLHIGIVANEPSGDQLGASLIRDLRKLRPEVRFQGVGGPLMIAEGCDSLLPMERLSVMGFVEVIRHLPELLRIRARLARHFRADPPDLFIGIDAPAFNLGLSERLRRSDIPTAQYVSPTVWAYRPGRVRTLRSAVDLVLSIFPFEEEFLRRHQVPVVYTGHPLAAELPLKPDREGARKRLGIAADQTLIALLPGSRLSEMRNLAADFVAAAALCLQRRPQLRFVAPLVNDTLRMEFQKALDAANADLPILQLAGNSRDALAASDLVLTASGTATMEALLMKRPMVVAYRTSPLTYRLGKLLIKIPYVAMSNLLAGEELAPELIQQECTPQALADALTAFLDAPERMREIRERYCGIHEQLRAGSVVPAAQAVLDLIERTQKPSNML